MFFIFCRRWARGDDGDIFFAVLDNPIMQDTMTTKQQLSYTARKTGQRSWGNCKTFALMGCVFSAAECVVGKVLPYLRKYHEYVLVFYMLLSYRLIITLIEVYGKTRHHKYGGCWMPGCVTRGAISAKGWTSTSFQFPSLLCSQLYNVYCCF